MTTATETTASLIGNTAAITNLVGTRYWPDKREVDNLPSITFQSISEIRNDHLDAPGKGKRCRMQINCYGRTRAEADDVADACEVALSATGRVVFRQSTYDREAQIYWTQLDWLVAVLNPT